MLNFWVKRKSRLCHARGTDQHVSQRLKTKVRSRICLQWKDRKRTKPNPSNFWSIPGRLGAFLRWEVKLSLANPVNGCCCSLGFTSFSRKGGDEAEQRRGNGVQGWLGKRRGSSACQFSADLMPTLVRSLNSLKYQLGKTTFLQVAFSSAVAGHAVFVLFKSLYVANCNTGWNEGRTFNYWEVVNVWESEYFKSPGHCFTGSWFLSESLCCFCRYG